MNFWQLAFNNKWVTSEQLKKVVITESNPKGEITAVQYKEITYMDYTY